MKVLISFLLILIVNCGSTDDRFNINLPPITSDADKISDMGDGQSLLDTGLNCGTEG
ncbi:hypothetical protein HDV02_005820, partial [Globomyces sp. JEL0801]